MKILHRPKGKPARLGILAGSFNPPTRAHLALAEAALAIVDEVLLALPQRLPHKGYSGATLDERAQMLDTLARRSERLAAGVAEGGLFAEIAKEARASYPESEIYLVCGRDAAERILNWDYGDPDFARRMLGDFRMLVAPREGEFESETAWPDAIQRLPFANYDACSSTKVREFVAADQEWTSLVPPEIESHVRAIYSRPRQALR